MYKAYVYNLCIIYCFAFFYLFKKHYGNYSENYDTNVSFQYLAWLSSTYLLYTNGAKFVVKASCIALSFKCSRKASEITTINAKQIGPEISKTRTGFFFFKTSLKLEILL